MSCFARILTLIFILISSEIYASTDIRYQLVDKQDTSYANVDRGVIRIRIIEGVIPDEYQLKELSTEAWKGDRGKWRVGTVFTYVEDMPKDGAAYGIAEFKHARLVKFTLNRQALEVHKFITKKKSNPQEVKYLNSVQHDANSLVVGKKYSLPKQMLLMPELEPSDPATALDLVIQLKPGDIIQIAGQSSKNNNIWYEVFAYDATEKHIGYGWINSKSLSGEKLNVKR